MNRNDYRTENQSIQRRYEEKYFPRVSASIKHTVDETIKIIEQKSIQTGIDHLNKQISNTRLTAIVQDMALEVGLRFARRTWRDLQEQRRNAKPAKMGGIVIDRGPMNSNEGEEFFTGVGEVANALSMHSKQGARAGIGGSNPSLSTKGLGFNDQWVAWIKRFLFDFIVEKITFEVFRTTKDTLIRVLSEAITNGWGVAETVKALKELPIPITQAARIVRTEITRAANAGVMSASETFPYEQQKEWISAHDKRTRGQKPSDHASHIGLDGTVIDYEDVFIDPINGDRLRFPGDPNASAASVINCRCSVAVTAKVNELGRLIPKQVNQAA